MDDLLDMIISDESPSQVSDKIKDILFAKSAERVNEYRPNVATSMFDVDFEDEEEINDNDNE